MFKEEPFINELGEVIKPGDVVVFAATNWKRTNLGKGIYEGFHENKDYRGQNQITSVRVRHLNKTKTRFAFIDGKCQRVNTNKPVYSILILKRIFKSADCLIRNEG